MFFLTCSKNSNQVLHKLEKQIEDLSPEEYFCLRKKINSCPYRVFLIGDDPLLWEIDSQFWPTRALIESIHFAWMSIFQSNDPDATSMDRLYLRDVLVKVPNKLEQSNTFLFQINEKFVDNTFVFLIRDRDLRSFSPLELMPIILIWQLNQEHIPLHASGVIHGDGLYLFSGPSGAGKSTVAELSKEIGREILDDDQVMIYSTDSNYSAKGWGHNLYKSTYPIRSVFRLIQADDDKLIPISQMQAYSFLFQQALEITAKNLPLFQYRKLSGRISKFVKNVPLFDLYFRKTPFFWELIDAELPFE